MFDFTVITTSYNSELTIEETLKSVLNQKEISFEYIIIDGVSTDNTLNIVKHYKETFKQISFKIISEKDRGVYDAMNKGIDMAKGKVIAILNSDDLFAYDTVLKDIFLLYSQGYDIIYSDLLLKDFKLKNIVRNWKVKKFPSSGFKNGWHPAHPSFFMSKNSYDLVKGFNLTYTISADFDLMLRSFLSKKLKHVYFEKYTTIMRLGGMSNNSILNIIKGNIQVLRSLKNNGFNFVYTYPFKRFWLKIFQYKIK
ncbi:glycosyltransferase [Flavobacteriaceae bacterium]|nr:glycosyltransferase [Flavobacteriaceae bacterium]